SCPGRVGWQRHGSLVRIKPGGGRFHMADPMVGEIRLLAGSEVPPGWAACDGQVLPIREHRELYAVLGTTYGGDGRTTFALPDLRGRTPVHPDGATFRAGAAGGEKQHALTASELPGH